MALLSRLGLPAPRDHVVGGAIDGAVYVAGGRAGSIESVTDRVDAYDVRAGLWRSVAPLPIAHLRSSKRKNALRKAYAQAHFPKFCPRKR